MSYIQNKITVLLVDDDPYILELMRTILQEMDFTVVAEGDNGHKGVALFQQHQPDLTIMDIEMPDMDGIEAVKAIKKTSPMACVAMLTSTDPRETLDFTIAAGAVDFIRKGQTPEQLITEIAAIRQKNFGR